MPDPVNRAGSVGKRLQLTILICVHILTCVISFLYALHYKEHYIFYDVHQLPYAVGLVAAFSLIGPLFIFARFSFGYFVGFYFYTMVLGFLWLSCFTTLNYDQRIARLSAIASIIAFLLPALFVLSPPKRVFEISPRAFERLLGCILALSLLTIAVASTYNFRFVTLNNIYDFRPQLEFPTIIRYLIGIVSSALLPFVFACFVLQSKFWRASAVLILLLLFYPITLTKLTLFAPLWLVGLGLLSRLFESRATAILSLLLPMLVGAIVITLFKEHARDYFDVVNFRMITIPSSAMNVYNDFFSRHVFTYFCQISILKPLMSCPYQEQLSIILERVYGLGNFNASLFATEGIASVGPILAPAAAFLCGLVIGLANRLSAGLPARFILMSGGVLPQVLLNVSLSTTLLTYGAAILFLLWYVTPRAMFKRNELRAHSEF